MSRLTRAKINIDALVNNFRVLRNLAPQSQHLAVVKADAYGHGALRVTEALNGLCSRFAVAIVEEAIALRESGVRTPIVVLEGPHQQEDCLLAAQYDLILVVHSEIHCKWITQLSISIDKKPDIWIKVDTGMHRLGFDVNQVADIVAQNAHLINSETHLCTHMACADDIQSDTTTNQLSLFEPLAKSLNLPVSIANSPSTIAWQASRGNWNRLGVAMYGSYPFDDTYLAMPRIIPVMTLEASVIAIKTIKKGEGVGYGHVWRAPKDSCIAVVGIGYGDGYPRHCAHGTPVAINGQKAGLVGRVSMDMITIDVSHIKSVNIGDMVELWGEQININDVASMAGTISYELMTRISTRVPKITVSRKRY